MGTGSGRSGGADPTWRDMLAGLPNQEIMGTGFMARYGDGKWEMTGADKLAAHAIHLELVSRIATQRLGYGQGVEEAALASVHALFERARQALTANPGAATVEIMTLHVLNTHVRPFAAKWHAKSEAGLLRALDTSDEFRADLERTREALRVLDGMLRLVTDSPGYETVDEDGPGAAAVGEELARSVRWRPGGIAEGRSDPHAIGRDEGAAVHRRRVRYAVPDREWAAGLALSGGGIRSATFAIGMLAALARRGLLPQFDYLSTVSGGGYAGAFLTQLLGTPPVAGVGLGREDLPFHRTEGESEILRALRQRCRYLSGTFWERVFVAMRQVHGTFVNLILLVLAMAAFAYADALVRGAVPGWLAAALSVLAPLSAILVLAILGRRLDPTGTNPGRRHVALGLLFVVPPAWYLLGLIHEAWGAWMPGPADAGAPGRGFLPAIVMAAGSAAVAAALSSAFVRVRPVAVAVATGIVATLVETILYQAFAATSAAAGAAALGGLAVAFAIPLAALDVNLTSLHAYYRAKLSAAFLMTPRTDAASPVRLSAIDVGAVPFPIMNCALNVPGSASPKMRGRLSDIFSLTPVSVGSALLGHRPTADWEAANRGLDLATAMALSGAAASPQMGLRTTRLGSFWLTLLNVRLGLWLRKPGGAGPKPVSPNETSRPRLPYLFREFAATADESLDFVHVSDGGHIENLGVYELLRRRCRFILAVDGENDPAMTFHALTNLQRLVYIDFGVRIEADLDDLRLDAGGLSRSHFRFCRILYPGAGQSGGGGIGYMVYAKLSLTGNEGEFIRRYKLDQPAFPHHPTSDQFFTEAQFEAYRSLGEHVGDKLFLPAMVGGLAEEPHVDLEAWMKALGRSLL